MAWAQQQRRWVSANQAAAKVAPENHMPPMHDVLSIETVAAAVVAQPVDHLQVVAA